MIRKWKTADIDKLVEIEEANFVHYWTRQYFLDSEQNANFSVLVFENNCEIIGYLSYIKNQYEIDIANLAVVEKHRRQGIGSRLIDKLFSIAKSNKIEKINLEVKTDNYVAIDFYKHLGFAILGIRKAFYSKYEDAYTMAVFMEEIV